MLDDSQRERIKELIDAQRRVTAAKEAKWAEKEEGMNEASRNYLRYVGHLVENGQLGPEQLKEISKSPSPANPIEWANFPDGHQMRKAEILFESVSYSDLDWVSLQERLNEMRQEITQRLAVRAVIYERGRPVPIRLGFVDLRKLANLLKNRSWDHYGHEDWE